MRRRRPEPHDSQRDLELIMQTLMHLSERLERIEGLLKDDAEEEEEDDDT
jgi:hypothetical protein